MVIYCLWSKPFFACLNEMGGRMMGDYRFWEGYLRCNRKE